MMAFELRDKADKYLQRAEVLLDQADKLHQKQNERRRIDGPTIREKMFLAEEYVNLANALLNAAKVKQQ